MMCAAKVSPRHTLSLLLLLIVGSSAAPLAVQQALGVVSSWSSTLRRGRATLQTPTNASIAQWCTAHGATDSGNNACCVVVVNEVRAPACATILPPGTARALSATDTELQRLTGATSLSTATCSACHSHGYCPLGRKSFSKQDVTASGCVPGGKHENDDSGVSVQWCRGTCNGACIAIIATVVPFGCCLLGACILMCVRRRRNRLAQTGGVGYALGVNGGGVQVINTGYYDGSVAMQPMGTRMFLPMAMGVPNTQYGSPFPTPVEPVEKMVDSYSGGGGVVKPRDLDQAGGR